MKQIYCFSILAFGIEFGLFYWGATDPVALLWAIVLHFIFCLSVAVLMHRGLREEAHLKWWWFLWMFLTACGPFGVAIFLLSSLSARVYSRKAIPVEQWLKDVFPVLESRPATRLSERLLANWDDLSAKKAMVPFQVVMKYGSAEQKQNILAKIGKSYRPGYAKILKLALKDSSNATRVQSAAILAKIERKFSNKLHKLEKKLAKNPGDIALLRKLAKRCHQQSESGLIDAIKSRELRVNSALYFEKYLSVSKKDVRAELKLCAIYIELGRIEDALALIDSNLDGAESLEFAVLKIRALFETQDYELMHQFSDSFFKSKNGVAAGGAGSNQVLATWQREPSNDRC